MKYAHLVKVSVFSYERLNENKLLILEKFLKLFPFNLKDEKIKLKKNVAAGFNEKEINIYEGVLVKEKHINSFLANLVRIIDEDQKELILSQLEKRIDSNLDFFLRFDKNEYIENNKLIITDSGNCFHVKISVAAFPKKIENALHIVRMMFRNKF